MRLLKEVLNVTSDREVYELLREDMHAFREYRENALNGNQLFADIQTGITGKIESLGQNFDWLGNRVVVLGQEVDGVVKYFTYSIEEANKLFGLQINKWLESGLPFWQWLMEGFDGVFKHFLNEHYENEKEYHELMREELPLLDDKNFLRGNELPTTWDSPTDSINKAIKPITKEYHTLWDYVLNDKDMVEKMAAAGQDLSVVAPSYTKDNPWSDYSSRVKEAARVGNFSEIPLLDYMRTVKAEQLGLDISGGEDAYKTTSHFIQAGIAQGMKEGNYDANTLNSLLDVITTASDIESITDSVYKDIRSDANKLFAGMEETISLENGYTAKVIGDALGDLSTELYDASGNIIRNLTNEELSMVKNITANANINKEGIVTTLTNVGDKELVQSIANTKSQISVLGAEGNNTRAIIAYGDGQQLVGLNNVEVATNAVRTATSKMDGNEGARAANAEAIFKAYQDITGSYINKDLATGAKIADYDSALAYFVTASGGTLSRMLSDEVFSENEPLLHTIAEIFTNTGKSLNISTQTQDTTDAQKDISDVINTNIDTIIDMFKEALRQSGKSEEFIESLDMSRHIQEMATSGTFGNIEGYTTDSNAGVSTQNLDLSKNTALSSLINQINNYSDKWQEEASKQTQLKEDYQSGKITYQEYNNQLGESKAKQTEYAAKAYTIGKEGGYERNLNGSWYEPETKSVTNSNGTRKDVSSSDSSNYQYSAYVTSGGTTYQFNTNDESAYKTVLKNNEQKAQNSAQWWINNNAGIPANDPRQIALHEENERLTAQNDKLMGTTTTYNAASGSRTTTINNSGSSSGSTRVANSSYDYTGRSSSSSSSSSSDSGSSYNAYNTSSSYHSSYASSEVNNNARSGTSQSAKDSAAATIAEAKAEWAAAAARGDSAAAAAAHDKAEAARNSVGYQTDSSGSNARAYASGIEKGPVTYTGLAMLHGTPSEPEYVLNSDQAYNVLKYIATGNRPKDNIESYNNSVNKTTQYIVEGDIVLEGIDNPAEFWDGVTTAMSNRWNVTKNK